MNIKNSNLKLNDNEVIIQIKKFENCYFIVVTSSIMNFSNLNFCIQSEFDELATIVNIKNEYPINNEIKDLLELNIKALTKKLNTSIYISFNINVKNSDLKIIFDNIKEIIINK